MQQKITFLQIAYVSIILVAALLALVLPDDFIGNDPKLLYWVNLFSIITGLGGMYLTLRLFAFQSVRRAVREEEETAGFQAFCKWTKVRLGLLAFVLWSNVILYVASTYTTTPKYCMLIILVAFVFCWPSKTEFDAIRKA